MVIPRAVSAGPGPTRQTSVRYNKYSSLPASAPPSATAAAGETVFRLERHSHSYPH